MDHTPPDRRSPGRRCVKLRRRLSPQAELSNDCITSFMLIALFCREWSALIVPVPDPGPGPGPGPRPVPSPGSVLGPGAGSYEDVVWARPRPGMRDGLMLDHSVDGAALAVDMRPARPVSIGGRLKSPRGRLGDVGDSMGCMSSLLLLLLSGSPPPPPMTPPILLLLLSVVTSCVTILSDCSWLLSPPSWYSSSTKISGTVNWGTMLIRADFLLSTLRRNSRDQYSVSKNPITVFRRTASSTRCSRARRRRNSSSRRLLLSLMTLWCARIMRHEWKDMPRIASADTSISS